MINIKTVKSYCCEDISLIENYSLAVNDKKRWVCHHRLEIQNGISISIEELKSKNLYFHRPASELIFLMETEHKKLHGNNQRQETKEKIGVKTKELWQKEKHRKKFIGKHPWNYGLPSPMKGIKKSPEVIEKMREAKRQWWANHIISEEEHKRRSEGAKKVPPLSEKEREHLRSLYKGRHWKLVDGKRVWID